MIVDKIVAFFCSFLACVGSYSVASYGYVPQEVANNTQLKQMATITYPAGICRGTFGNGNGATPLCYAPGPSACTLNAGAGDNGSQVPSADGKCWLAIFAFGDLDPRQFGAMGNGTTNDTVPVQAAISYGISAQIPVQIGRQYLVGHLDATAGPLQMWGIGGQGYLNGQQTQALTCPSGFIAASANLNPLISITGNSTLKDFCIKAAAAGQNTAGSAISNESVCDNSGTCPAGASDTISNVLIDGPCIGIAMSGSYITLRGNFIANTQGAACGGIRIGAYTNSNRSVQPQLFNNTIFGTYSAPTPAAYGVLIQDAGGPLMTNNAIQTTHEGLYLYPSQDLIAHGSQAIQAINSTSNYWGDTVTDAGILIDTGTGAFGFVDGPHNFVGDWVAGGVNGVRINNTAAGGVIVSNFRFSHLRSAGHSDFSFKIVSSNVSMVQLSDSTACNDAGGFVSLASGVVGFMGNGNVPGFQCEASPFTMPVGYALGGSNAYLTIVGNELVGVTTPITGSPPPYGEGVIKANNGLDNVPQTVASAATVTFGYNNVILLTGSANVATINGNQNMQYTIICTGGVTFVSGGNIGNPTGCLSGMSATFLGGNWFVH